METIKAQCGTLIPASQIQEMHPQGEFFTVVTTRGKYKVAAGIILSLTKPRGPRPVTKKAKE